ncbi:MAG: hypothetical protein HY22_04400 [[Candidatus Thermochlorobacteriaceae] bacterium GBChlB]|nr:MAG: hypothetical protein HY22_04400 [[Candidatus Thermochlorobacteriaceae] bacterium GBChlB]
MIESMTGYGNGSCSDAGLHASAEIRSVNSRFIEISVKLPRQFSARELEVREFIRKELQRGKISVTVQLERDAGRDLPIRINVESVRAYAALLSELRTAAGIDEPIRLDHLLKFSEVFVSNEDADSGQDKEWSAVQKALMLSIHALKEMRRKEGEELLRDFQKRIHSIEETLDRVQALSQKTIDDVREKLRGRVREILVDESKISRERLELELVLLADKLDITEECVRFRSHNKFFLKTLMQDDSPGRKLNFLLQEQNREANTIAAKAQNADIAQAMVFVKEELEKIREQVQNIE